MFFILSRCFFVFYGLFACISGKKGNMSRETRYRNGSIGKKYHPNGSIFPPFHFACKGIFFCAIAQTFISQFHAIKHIVYDFIPYRYKSRTNSLCLLTGITCNIGAKAVPLHRQSKPTEIHHETHLFYTTVRVLVVTNTLCRPDFAICRTYLVQGGFIQGNSSDLPIPTERPAFPNLPRR